MPVVFGLCNVVSLGVVVLCSTLPLLWLLLVSVYLFVVVSGVSFSVRDAVVCFVAFVLVGICMSLGNGGCCRVV